MALAARRRLRRARDRRDRPAADLPAGRRPLTTSTGGNIVIEQFVDIDAKGGPIETFICHPERKGPWPVVIFYMDAPGIRDELHDMAPRTAPVGYYVSPPNLYYGRGRGVNPSRDSTPEGSADLKRMSD